jgi:hypothetical protein
VTANDVNITPISSFYFVIARQPTFLAPGSNTSVSLTSMNFYQQNGALSFTPNTAQLKPGTVVTFAYFIRAPSTGLRSNNATVTITIIDPGG